MKQESKNNESRCSVQSSSVTNQQAINTNSTKITQVQGSNQVAVQQNLVNWKWVVIDPVRFKDYPIPCIIRHTDSVKEYVSVRIVEKVILSKFEANLSEEAKNFGVLTTFFCTSDEIFTLNDINENHVDRLYGNEKFKIDIDTLVCLKTFLEFYEIIQRTVCFKNDLNQIGQNKLHHYQQQQQHQHLQLQQQQHQLQLQQNLHHQQQHIQQHQHQHQQQHQKQQQQQLHLQRAQSIQNFRMPLPRAAASVGYQQFIQNYPNQLSQRLVQRLPNFSQYNNQSNPNHFVNFMPNMINNLKATQINPMQHKLVQIVGAAPGQALPIIQATPTSLNHMTNLRNHNQNLISCLNSNQIQTSLQQTNPSLSIIDASMRNHPMPNTTIRNLTPPLTPLESMVSNLANDAQCNNVQPNNAHCNNVQPNNAQCNNVQPSNVHCNNVQPSNVQPKNVQPNNAHCNNVQPNNAHCNNVQPNNAHCSNVQPSNVQSKNVQPSNVQPSNVQPSNVQSKNVQPSNAQPKNVQPNNAQCSNVQLSAAREEKKSAVKKEEKLNRLDTSTDIFLIDDDQLNKSMEACDQSIDETAIDFNDETYGFVQVNDKILLYIDVEDAIYRYNRCLPKCSKHVLLVHLIKQLNVNCEMNDLKKNLKIKIIENNERIKSLIKWFNQKHAPMSLDVVTEAKLELVNIIQFQNVYAKEAIFFKNLHYFNQAGIDYYAEYNKVLCMQGGFVYVPIENKRNIRPFVRLGDQLLVSCNLVELVSKSLYSNRSEMETEKVTFDLRKDFKLIEQINEFCRLQTFYLSLHANKDFRKKNTQFFNLKKYLSLFPDNFKIFCQFDSNFPKSWLNDLDKIDKHNNKQSTLNTEHIPVDHTQTSDEAANNGQESVYMSPRSDDQSALQTISMALLNKKNSNQFSQEDFKHKPRLRSYSESTVLLKFSNKFKKLIKYKYLFRKRNSCTALQFLNRDQLIAKDHLLNNQVLTYMDKILEKKNIEKKLSKKDKIQTSIPIEIKQEKIHSYNQLEQPEFKELPSTSSCCSQNVCSPKTNQKSKVSPHTPPTIESLKKELQIKTKSKHSANDCSFLIDSPSQSKPNKQIKRKNSKIVDEFRKRARLIGQQKELHELKKDLSFLVPDDRIMPLSENEHFNFVPKKMAQPKNLLAIKQADQTDLYSTDSFDENFYIKKYNVNANSKVVVEKIDIGKYLKRMNQVKKVKRKKCKNAQKSDKLSKSLSSKTTSACNSADFSSNENLFRKPSKKNVLLVESDDEDQLPRLDLDYSKL